MTDYFFVAGTNELQILLSCQKYVTTDLGITF